MFSHHHRSGIERGLLSHVVGTEAPYEPMFLSEHRIYIVFAKDEHIVTNTKATILECVEHIKAFQPMEVEAFLQEPGPNMEASLAALACCS